MTNVARQDRVRARGRRCVWLGVWGMLLLAGAAAGGEAGEDPVREGERILRDAAAFLEGSENRFPGMPGNEAMSRKVEASFRAAGVSCGSTRFEGPVFVPGRASLHFEGRDVALQVLLPNLVELSALPEKRFPVRVVYVGRGTLAELDGKSLKGTFCLFDFDCDFNYLDVMSRGALGCLFLEPEAYWSSLAYSKVLGLPLSIPRFQVGREDGAFLRQAASAAEGVACEAEIEPSRWENRIHKNHWALIEGSDPEAKRELVILQTDLDSMHYCPALASGAQDGLNLKLLIDFFQRYAAKPAGRSLLFQVFNGSRQCNLGATEAVFHLFGPEEDIFNVDKSRASEERSDWRVLVEAEYVLKHYPRLAPERITPDALADFRDRQDKPAGQTFPLAYPLIRLMELHQHGLGEKRKRLFRTGALTPEQAEAIAAELSVFGDLVTLFNKFGRVKVYDAALLRRAEIRDWDGFLSHLVQAGEVPATTPGKRVWERLAPEMRELLSGGLAQASGEAAADAEASIMEALNGLLRDAELFAEAAWQGVELQPRSAELLAARKAGTLPPEAVTRLNRFLLEDAFPAFLSRLPKALPEDLTPEQRRIFEQFRQKVMRNVEARRPRARELPDRLQEVKSARQILKPYHPLVAFGLNLTYANRWLGITKGAEGPGSDCGDGSSQVDQLKTKYGLAFTNRLAALAEGIQRKTGIRYAQGNTDVYLFKDRPPLACTQYILQQIPAFAFLAPFDMNGWRLGSGDRLDALDPETVARKQRFVTLAIEEILRDAKTSTLAKSGSDGELNSAIPWRSFGSAEIETRVQDGSSLTRPETIMRDALVVLPLTRRAEVRYNGTRREVAAASCLKGGVLSYRLVMSDTDGRAFFYNGGQGATFGLQIYHLDARNRIDHAADQGLLKMKYPSSWWVAKGFSEHRLLAGVLVEKADLYDLYHPKTLRPVGLPKLEKAKGGQVERFSTAGLDKQIFGFGSLFMPEEERAKILFTGSVSLVNSTPAVWDGEGFGIADLDRRSAPLVASQDVVRLNEHRVEDLRVNAVTDNLMETLHRKSVGWRDGAGDNAPSLEVLRGQGRYLDAFRRLMKSYGAAFTAYPVVKATISDMMKAVIFYLAVLIPFAFFLQRLLFNFVRVEAQIASFVGLFLVTYLVFHCIHPAFRIAKNPQIVLIAFTMLTLAGFVALALKGKFDYHMESFKERFQSEEDVGVLKLAGTAMMIGVTNMKRRRLRTTLTCLTIVLITFTMLSFTSVSQSVAPTRVHKGDDVPYNGIFYARQTWDELDRRSVDILAQVLGEGGDALQRGFAAFQGGEESVLLASRVDREIPLRGILALQAREDGWLTPMPVVAGRFFQSDDALEIVVTDAFARDSLGLDLGPGGNALPADMWLTVNGLRLKLVGLVDGEKMSSIRDLRGTSIVPQEISGKTGFDTRSVDVQGEEEIPEGTFQDVNARFYVVIPFGIRNLLDVPVVSVSIRMPSAAEVWQRTLEFAHYSDNKVYFGAQQRFEINPDRQEHEDPVYELPGRYYLGSGFETSIGGLSQLIIPLLVSATIIFNTMLGAVYERRKEIGIFNAIGLNPIHIALFFVAEAVVYGILGGVGGYLIGQVLAQVIVKLRLLPDINLNYSSLTVVYVILFTMGIVIVSTIYPALVAMRTASSSSGRKRIEKAGENRLQVQFPYSFTREMAVAVNSYLKEYFDKHSDSSVGEFVATPLACQHEDEDGKMKMVLRYDVALAPYDLGVTQVVTIVTRFNREVGAFMVEAESERRSGQEANWMATNQPFMNAIRKYLLHWRVLSREGQEAHMAEGMRLFDLEAGADNPPAAET